jgi:hypothetical protein
VLRTKPYCEADQKHLDHLHPHADGIRVWSHAPLTNAALVGYLDFFSMRDDSFTTPSYWSTRLLHADCHDSIRQGLDEGHFGFLNDDVDTIVPGVSATLCEVTAKNRSTSSCFIHARERTSRSSNDATKKIHLTKNITKSHKTQKKHKSSFRSIHKTRASCLRSSFKIQLPL